MFGLSRSTIYKRVSEKAFPAPLRISERSVRWRMADLADWSSALRSRRARNRTSRGTDWATIRPQTDAGFVVFPMKTLAERAGFEPALGDYPKHAFQACDLNRSSTSPWRRFYAS